MLKSDRQEMILNILQDCKSIMPKELAEKTYTSYSSIRRDLEELEKSGLIIRNYGKVEIANAHPILISYPMRIAKNSKQKQAAAKKAATLISEGDTIFIDSSSSCSYFVREILNIKGITVVTNSVEVLYFLTQHNINVMCSGGLQDEANRYALVGATAEKTFSDIHADWVVFSVRSLTKEGDLYDIHYNETIVRKMMLKNAEKKIFLCDSSKIDTISTYYQCKLSDIDYLVCDSKLAKDYKKIFPELVVL